MPRVNFKKFCEKENQDKMVKQKNVNIIMVSNFLGLVLLFVETLKVLNHNVILV